MKCVSFLNGCYGFRVRAGISSIHFSHSVETEKCFCWSSLTYGVGASPGAPRPVSIGQTFQHPCSFVNSSSEAAVAFNPRVNHRRPESTSTGGFGRSGGDEELLCEGGQASDSFKLCWDWNNKLNSLPLSAVTQSSTGRTHSRLV